MTSVSTDSPPANVRRLAKKVLGHKLYALLGRAKRAVVPPIGNSRAYPGATIAPTAILRDRGKIKIGSEAEIQDYVLIDARFGPVVIGDFSQINPFTVIYGGGGVHIGNNVLVAPHCVLVAGNHDYRQLDVPMRFAGAISAGPIRIEDDVWIGASVTITDGVTIGRGAVVGANSVVTRNVAPFDIVAGAPAKPIGSRLGRTRSDP